MAVSVTDIYRSSNGDCWRLIRYPDSGHSFVRHEPNPASGDVRRIPMSMSF